MECLAVSVVKPVAWIQRKQINLRPLGESRWFIHNEAASVHSRLNRHEGSLALPLLPNKRLHPTAAGQEPCR